LQPPKQGLTLPGDHTPTPQLFFFPPAPPLTTNQKKKSHHLLLVLGFRLTLGFAPVWVPPPVPPRAVYALWFFLFFLVKHTLAFFGAPIANHSPGAWGFFLGCLFSVVSFFFPRFGAGGGRFFFFFFGGLFAVPPPSWPPKNLLCRPNWPV